MTYQEWVVSVPPALTNDPLWKVKAYRYAVFAADLAWADATKLMRDKRTISLSDQLYRAVGSISANISEGYSRQSGKDQARFYEYALGSARESRDWYFQGRHILSETVATHRINLATEIIRLLLTMIPSERGYKVSEDRSEYNAYNHALLDNPPLPEP